MKRSGLCAFALCAALAGCGNATMNGAPPLDLGPGPDLSGSARDLAMPAADGASDGGLDGALIGDAMDDVGPAIVIESPTSGSFIGGEIQIRAKITDPSGVDPSTVAAVMGGDTAHPIALAPIGVDEYGAFYNVAALGSGFVLPTLSVRAKDRAGNQGETAIEVIVDNVPPTESLDPPAMRASKTLVDMTTKAQQTECSQAFDPVGDESMNEGQITTDQILTIRAMVEDDGNYASGLNVVRFSGIDGASVELYVMSAPAGTALAVDTDGDGSCDEINPSILPVSGMVTGSNQAVALPLVPIPAGGAPDFRQIGTLPSGCDAVIDTAAQQPPPLCAHAGTSISYVLLNGADPLSAIWTIPPILADAYGCVGFQFDTKNHLGQPGPTCAIVRARDKAGNVSVSAPLHFCLDDGAGSCNGYAPQATDCTGKLDKTSGQLVAGGSCTPRVFGSKIVSIDP